MFRFRQVHKPVKDFLLRSGNLRLISTLKEMTENTTKRVFFVRHGEGEHNVAFHRGDRKSGGRIRDPCLTDVGKQQATSISPDTHPVLKDTEIELIVSSPLSRTIQTTILVFKEKLETDHPEVAGDQVEEPSQSEKQRERKIILHPDMQETGDVNCDTGKPLEETWDNLKTSVEAHIKLQPSMLCTKLLDINPKWHKKEGDYAHDGKKIKARLRRFTKWLLNRPERNIAIVGHHNIFLALLEFSFMNCEVREYALDVSMAQTLADQETDAILKAWRPVYPLPLAADSNNLSNAEKEHLRIHLPYCVEKFTLWGYPIPENFR